MSKPITTDELAQVLTYLSIQHAVLADLVGKQNACLIEASEHTALLQKGLSELREQVMQLQMQLERLEAAQGRPALH